MATKAERRAVRKPARAAAKRAIVKRATAKRPAVKRAAAKRPAAKRPAQTRSARKAAAAPRRKPVATPRKSGGTDTVAAVSQFLFRQAECLDGRRWAEFIELFTADGVYWMPAAPEQTTGDGVPSIFYEDRDLMTVRMKRVTHPHAWSQSPAWGTSHLVSNVTIESENSRTGDIIVRSRFHMMEFRRDESRHFAGSYRHHLMRGRNGYQIKQQRVDLVNGEGPFDYVLQIWV